MLKKIILFYFVNLCFVLLCFTPKSIAQKIPVSLKKNDDWGKPFHFFIAQVSDKRNNATLGMVYDANRQLRPLYEQTSVEKFIQSYAPVTADTLAYPIVIQLKQLEIKESIANKTVNGTCRLSLSFGYTRANDDEVVHLGNYHTTTKFTRSLGLYEHYDQLIEKAMQRAFVYFNDWMKNHYDKDLKLARKLQITLLPDASVENPDQGDSLFWSPERKLRWTDFQGKPTSANRYAAQVFSNFEYTGQVDFSNGVVHLGLQMKAYVLKSHSWNASAGTSLVALEHEQLHFDITKLIVERFKQRALLINTPEDYDSALQLLFIDMYREMNKMQKQYDEETHHSLNAVAQERWRDQIQRALRLLLKTYR